MAKKTRKQKILADSRHVQYHLETTPAQVSHSSEKRSKIELPEFVSTSQPRTIQTTSNLQVITDIKKTAYITATIVTAQVLLYIALNRL